MNDDAPADRPGAEADPWLGETLDGRFRLEERLDAGDRSRVYKADHLRLGGKVAVKLLPASASGRDAIARLEREARTVTLIGHDNIVKVLDFAELDRVAYLAMEYLRGETLLDRIERQGPLPLDRLCTILTQVAVALAAAHASDLIHRDIHPGNIFLCRERGRSDVPKILDFGLASLWPLRPGAAPAERPSRTQLARRPSYVAPETLTAPATADHRVDLYALGATFYHALAGRPPFVGADQQLSPEKFLAGDFTPLSELVPGLPMAQDVDELVDFALQRNPAHRVGSADIFRRALVELRKGMNVPTRRREERPTPPEKRTLASWVSNGRDFSIVELAGALDSASVMVNVSGIASRRVSLRLARVSSLDSEGCYKWSRWLRQLRAHCVELTLHDCSPTLVRQADLDPSFLQSVPVVSVLAPFYCAHCGDQVLVSVTRDEARTGRRLSPVCPVCSLPMRFDEVRETYFRFWFPPPEEGAPGGC